jgi:putative membrane protein
MKEFLIRPSTKLVMVNYVFAAVLAAAVFIVGNSAFTFEYWAYLLIVPALWLVRTVFTHLSRMFTTISITGDKLRYDHGFLSKTTRTIPLVKVQDVRVDRTVAQRLWGVGDLSIETAGETSRLSIQGIDSPQVVAEKILELASQLNSR